MVAALITSDWFLSLNFKHVTVQKDHCSEVSLGSTETDCLRDSISIKKKINI